MSILSLLVLIELTSSSVNFSCGDGKMCPQMSSCEEACYHFITCGESVRDGDNDGIPCENVCSEPCNIPSSSSGTN